MKKLLAVFLIAALSLSMLSCDRQPSPAPETSPPESPAPTNDPPEEKKPEVTPDVTNPPAGKPNYTPVPLEIGPEREAFFNEPKDPWGKKDMAVYAPDGEMIFEATKTGYENSALLNHRIDPAVTYRGIALGDDAYHALQHMDLPEEAVLILQASNTSWIDEWITPYNPETFLELANSDDYRVLSVHLYLDKNLNPINAINDLDPTLYPGTYSPYIEYNGIQLISIGALLDYVELGARSMINIGIGKEIINRGYPIDSPLHSVSYDDLKIDAYYAERINIQEYYAVKNQEK